MDSNQFLGLVYEYYGAHGRKLPWRVPEPNGRFDPYKILVSEMMLQQTQVRRVEPKYQAFLANYPNVDKLARARLAEVLKLWSGLGYNRRAKYLWEAARQLTSNNEPWTIDDLTACKGVGYNTAAAVLVYAHNHPYVFIETNIRTVLIHHFYANKVSVNDKELGKTLSRVIDRSNPREFYWAMMDYGAWLKRSAGNAASKSKHYRRQGVFKGSQRELRGRILRLLLQGPKITRELAESTQDERIVEVLNALELEGFIHLTRGRYEIK